ncbi:MAG: hypothetical protein JWP46_4369 [Modestobacter sp.]|nr:hypothetical protein [Modestobacter sp.]
MVGGDTDRLTDGGDAGRPVPRCTGVLERQLRIVVEEATGGDKVLTDGVGVARLEAAQGGADSGVQVANVDPLGDFGATRTALRRAVGRPASARATLLPTGPVGGAAFRTPTTEVTPRCSVARRAIPCGTAVLPRRPVRLGAPTLGAVTLRAVPRRTAVLPARPVTLGTPTLGTPTLGTVTLRAPTLRAVPRRTAVLPARPVPLRTPTLRAVPRGAAVLPLAAGST